MKNVKVINSLSVIRRLENTQLKELLSRTIAYVCTI